MLSSFPKMRKQRPKSPCARVWLYSFEDIVVLASSAKMAPPANVALLRAKLAEVTSDMSTCVCERKFLCLWQGSLFLGLRFTEFTVQLCHYGNCIHSPPTWPVSMWLLYAYQPSNTMPTTLLHQHDSTHTVSMTPPPTLLPSRMLRAPPVKAELRSNTTSPLM